MGSHVGKWNAIYDRCHICPVQTWSCTGFYRRTTFKIEEKLNPVRGYVWVGHHLPFSDQLFQFQMKAIWYTIHHILGLLAVELRTVLSVVCRRKRMASLIVTQSLRAWLCFWAPNPNRFVKFASRVLRSTIRHHTWHRCRRPFALSIVSIYLRMHFYRQNARQNRICPAECADSGNLSEIQDLLPAVLGSPNSWISHSINFIEYFGNAIDGTYNFLVFDYNSVIVVIDWGVCHNQSCCDPKEQ